MNEQQTKLFRTVYLKQQNMEYTDENWDVYGTDAEISVIAETKDSLAVFSVIDQPMYKNQWISVINKNTLEMETIEL